VRRIVCAAALVLLARAAAAESFTIRVHETATIDLPGTTAAYAIDATIADVSVARAGAVSVTGRTAGTTQLIAVTPAGTKAYLVTVAAPVSARVPGAVKSGEPIARVESRYSSGSSQVQSSVDVFTVDDDRRSQFHLLNVHYLRVRSLVERVSVRLLSPDHAASRAHATRRLRRPLAADDPLDVGARSPSASGSVRAARRLRCLHSV
jgi:hypothetical protein